MIERCLCEYTEDPVLCFDPDDNVFRFHRDIDFGLLLVLAGVFKSVTQAHSMNFAGPVPKGWTCTKFNGFCIYILNKLM